MNPFATDGTPQAAPLPAIAGPLLDLLPLAIVMVDADHRVLYVNATYLALFEPAARHPNLIGLPATELLDLIAPCFLDPAAIVENTRAAAEAQRDQRGRRVFMTNGRVLDRDLYYLPNGARLVTFTDVTESTRQRTEQLDLARLPDLNPNPVMRYSASGQLLYANPAAQALREHLSPEVIDGSRDWMIAACQEAMTQGQPTRMEFPLLGGFFEMYLMPFPHEQYVNVYLLDITARHEAEEGIKRQHTFYETILAHLPIEVVALDTDLRYRFVNPQALRNPEVRQWIIGHDDLEFFAYRGRPRAQAEERQRLMRQALAEHRQVSWEETVPRPEGTQYLTRTMQPVFDSAGQPLMFVGYGLDITPAREAQRVLEESEKRYRELLHYTQALICTHTLEGIVLSVNPAITELLGLPEAALIGHSLAEMMLPEDRSGLDAYLAQFTASPDATSTGIFRLLPHRATHPRYLLYHNVRVDRPGADPYIIGYAQDITERIEAERASRHAQEAAEAAAKARANFLASMSHEIRTPLNGILGLAALLAKTSLEAEQRQWVELISTSGRTLLNVLNDVLDMSKISSGRLEMIAVPFDLSTTLRAAAQPLAIRANEKRIGLTVRSIPKEIVVGDPHRLVQIMTNLLANAVKFTEHGGVSLEGHLLRATSEALTITFLVHDSGIGIPPNMQEAVFEEFTQAYADTAHRYGGTGLGLAISARLVGQMGGHLVMTSELGKGTTFGFTLTLPRAPVTEAAPAQEIATVLNLQGRRVLLAEDHNVNRLLVRLMLTNQGAQVIEAVDGAEAITMVREEPPFDVVLMDIQMPNVNGLEATAAIRALGDPQRANVPIIALTANAFRTDVKRYLAAGMNDCLTKPFEEADLLQALWRLLGNISQPPLAAAYGTDGEALLTPAVFPATALRLGRGNPAFVRQLVEKFLLSTSALAGELAAPSISAAGVAAIAHKLAPSARLLDAHELADTLAMLEILPSTHPTWPDVREYAQQQLDDLLTQTAEWLSRQPTD